MVYFSIFCISSNDNTFISLLQQLFIRMIARYKTRTDIFSTQDEFMILIPLNVVDLEI